MTTGFYTIITTDITTEKGGELDTFVQVRRRGVSASRRRLPDRPPFTELRNKTRKDKEENV